MRNWLWLLLALLVVATPAAARRDRQLAFVVDRSERRVYIYRGPRLVRVYAVAVGKPGYETPLGVWHFHQVDINPDWNPPPDRDWTRNRSYTPPGHPANPMGRARLIFDRPYTIHGTRDFRSLGTAASHGSIRIADPIAVQLAELLLKEGGAWRGRRWFLAMLQDPMRMYPIPIARRVPISVIE